MPPKLIKAADVCKLADVQPYVLRSWEKEFPGIGVDSSTEGRLYRPADVEQVRRIRQLVFSEGLTVSGARRRLEAAGATQAVSDEAAAEVLDALGADARRRLAAVREGLASILAMLGGIPGDEEFGLRPAGATPASPRSSPARGKAAPSKGSPARPRAAAPAKGGRASKRKRASA
jgi:DNA-binding transcriptional MerR regulator